MMIMVFLFFFFLGLLAIFLYQARNLGQQLQALSEEHAQLRVLLRALESRMDGIAALEKVRGINPEQTLHEAANEKNETVSHDPLLHLSFDKNSELPQQTEMDGPLRLN